MNFEGQLKRVTCCPKEFFKWYSQRVYDTINLVGPRPSPMFRLKITFSNIYIKLIHKKYQRLHCITYYRHHRRKTFVFTACWNTNILY